MLTTVRDAIRSAGKSQGARLVALYGCMYYGMLRPSEAVSLLLDECQQPAEGWGRLELREVHSAAGREWTDDGEVHEARRPKGGPKNAVRRVPIPPQLVSLLREHVESYGIAADGRLFWTYRGGIYQPSTLWQVLQKARAAVFPPVLVASPLAHKPYDFRHAGISWRLNAGTPARRWPSGPVIAWKCSTESTRTASTGTMSGGTSGWSSSLARRAWRYCWRFRQDHLSGAEAGP